MTSNPEPKDQLTCPVCGRDNRAGTQICRYCGSLIGTAGRSSPMTRALRTGTRQLQEDAARVLDSQPAEKPDGSNNYQTGMSLKLQVEGTPKSIVITPDMLKEQVIIGRRDPITEQSPPVDLDDFAGYRMGVSRKHAILELLNGNLMVSDLGSSNGTYLNGKRLPMRQPQVVINGDMIRLGQIAITVQFVSND
jgi:hypothetical protein